MKFDLYYSWLKLKTILTYDWENPFFLYLIPLPLVIILISSLLNRKRRSQISLSFSVPLEQNKWSLFISYIPKTVEFICLLCIILAIASPYKKIIRTEIKQGGVDMVIALDLSSSMLTQDVLPSRLEVAKKLAISFAKNRIQDQISIVAFAGAPYLASPLTSDLTYVTKSLSLLETKQIKEEGTALGDALGMSINQIREEKNPKKVAIVISDGNNTTGNLDPITAATLAKSFGIKVYTIAVGSNKPSLDPVDESTLRLMAEKSNGQFYRATDKKTLNAIFKEIDFLEKSRTLQVSTEIHEDVKPIFIKLAFLFFCISILLKLTPISNILED
jgi:Ca-activated chloride channel family protein